MYLLETVKTLMLNEHEIIHWIKHMKRFDFKHKDFFHFEQFLIGLSTKLLINDAKVKEIINVGLTKLFNN